jgi:hypothetical protein
VAGRDRGSRTGSPPFRWSRIADPHDDGMAERIEQGEAKDAGFVRHRAGQRDKATGSTTFGLAGRWRTTS